MKPEIIAAVVAGVLFLLFFVLLGIWTYLRRRRDKAEQEQAKANHTGRVPGIPARRYQPGNALLTYKQHQTTRIDSFEGTPPSTQAISEQHQAPHKKASHVTVVDVDVLPMSAHITPPDTGSRPTTTVASDSRHSSKDGGQASPALFDQLRGSARPSPPKPPLPCSSLHDPATAKAVGAAVAAAAAPILDVSHPMWQPRQPGSRLRAHHTHNGVMLSSKLAEMQMQVQNRFEATSLTTDHHCATGPIPAGLVGGSGSAGAVVFASQRPPRKQASRDSLGRSSQGSIMGMGMGLSHNKVHPQPLAQSASTTRFSHDGAQPPLATAQQQQPAGAGASATAAGPGALPVAPVPASVSGSVPPSPLVAAQGMLLSAMPQGTMLLPISTGAVAGGPPHPATSRSSVPPSRRTSNAGSITSARDAVLEIQASRPNSPLMLLPCTDWAGAASAAGLAPSSYRTTPSSSVAASPLLPFAPGSAQQRPVWPASASQQPSPLAVASSLSSPAVASRPGPASAMTGSNRHSITNAVMAILTGSSAAAAADTEASAPASGAGSDMRHEDVPVASSSEGHSLFTQGSARGSVGSSSRSGAVPGVEVTVARGALPPRPPRSRMSSDSGGPSRSPEHQGAAEMGGAGSQHQPFDSSPASGRSRPSTTPTPAGFLAPSTGEILQPTAHDLRPPREGGAARAAAGAGEAGAAEGAPRDDLSWMRERVVIADSSYDPHEVFKHPSSSRGSPQASTSVSPLAYSYSRSSSRVGRGSRSGAGSLLTSPAGTEPSSPAVAPATYGGGLPAGSSSGGTPLQHPQVGIRASSSGAVAAVAPAGSAPAGSSSLLQHRASAHYTHEVAALSVPSAIMEGIEEVLST